MISFGSDKPTQSLTSKLNFLYASVLQCKLLEYATDNYQVQATDFFHVTIRLQMSGLHYAFRLKMIETSCNVMLFL